VVENWWSKYRVNLREIEEERDSAGRASTASCRS
jgi:hypothetical protein